VGKTIASIGEKLSKLDEDQRPEKVMIVIQTDGQENASMEYKKDDIKKMIEEQTNKYNWVFQFIGADLASVTEAQSWGIGKDYTSSYSISKSAGTMDLLSEKMLYARSASVKDYAKSMEFSESDKSKIN
jgi:hypothetical protein